jgi:hypothetical protein
MVKKKKKQVDIEGFSTANSGKAVIALHNNKKGRKAKKKTIKIYTRTMASRCTNV